MTEATTIAYNLITRVYKSVNRIYSKMLYQNGSFCKHRKKTIYHLMLLLLNPSYFNFTQRLGLDSHCSGCSIAWNIFLFKSVKDYAKIASAWWLAFYFVAILCSNSRSNSHRQQIPTKLHPFEETKEICYSTEDHGALHRVVNTFLRSISLESIWFLRIFWVFQRKAI